MTDFHQLDINALRPAPWNPRGSLDDPELLASVNEHGILQPLVVRPVLDPLGTDDGELFEIICGNRRWAAAKAAELEEVPVVVRNLDDAEALAVALTENLQRHDLHPISEGEAIKSLHIEHGQSVDEIAANLGKSKSFVYGRLKLCELTQKGRKLCLEGKLPPSAALLVARIPDAKLQNEALDELLLEVDHDSGRVIYEDAKRCIEADFMLRLEQAPFDTADAELVPKAGPCTTCPHRTGCQPELFADVESKDLCTLPSCFEAKRKADWAKRAQAAKQTGQKVLDEAEAKKVFPWGSAASGSSKYVPLDEKHFHDPKRRTYKQLLGKDAPVPVLAQDKTGAARELVERKVANKLLKERHDWAKPAREREDPKAKAEREKAAREKKVAEAAHKAALAELVEKVEAASPAKASGQPDVWRIVLHAVLDTMGEGPMHAVKRRDIDDEKMMPEEILRAELGRMKLQELVALALEVAIASDLFCWKADDKLLRGACKLFGVDLAKHRKDAEKALAPTKKKATKKRALKKGASKAEAKSNGASASTAKPKRKRAAKKAEATS